MGRLRRTAGAACVAAATLGTVMLSAGPAAAVTEGCTIRAGSVSCSTSARPMPANATTHQIYIEARGASDPVTCYAYDLNGDLVGQVSAPRFIARGKTIGGLYGWYFLTCVGAGYAGGSISNG
jgi:hypothetical protein